MEEEEEMLPPFWLQTNSDTPRRRRLRRSSSSLLLNSGFLLILLLAIAFYFFFIVIPSFLSFTSQLFKPHLVKKGWDSLNLVLVLFAIICGFLSRNSNENGTSTSTNTSTRSYEDQGVSSAAQDVHDHKSNPYEYSDRTAGYNVINRLRRNSSSYPDLRQESAWITPEERWRFYDDQQLFHHHQPRREPQEEEEDLDTKNTAVEASVVPTEEVSIPSYTPPPPPPSPPPPRTPPKVVKRKPKRTHQALEDKEMNDTPEKSDSQVKNFQRPPPRPPPPAPPPPPTPPPPPSVFEEVEKKSGKNEKKRGVTTKDILSSLRRRKKKQRQKSVENFDTFLNSQAPASSSSYSHPLYPPPSPPPPPPPLPPPPSVFHNLFSSKKGKNKKNHSVPPPPPPPPPMRASKFSSERPIMTHRPPLPSKVSNFNGEDDNVSSGSESPILVPIKSQSPPPPPPPPPPFKIPEWKYVAHGDHFVRIKSDNSSRSGSPDLDDGEGTSPSKETGQSSGGMDGGDSTTPMFCPSPDVNSKADSFIARFRAGLRLEKMNSMKERGRSNLCPEPSPNSEAEEGAGPS